MLGIYNYLVVSADDIDPLGRSISDVAVVLEYNHVCNFEINSERGYVSGAEASWPTVKVIICRRSILSSVRTSPPGFRSLDKEAVRHKSVGWLGSYSFDIDSPISNICLGHQFQASFLTHSILLTARFLYSTKVKLSQLVKSERLN